MFVGFIWVITKLVGLCEKKDFTQSYWEKNYCGMVTGKLIMRPKSAFFFFLNSPLAVHAWVYVCMHVNVLMALWAIVTLVTIQKC